MSVAEASTANGRNWVYRSLDQDDVNSLARRHGVSEVVASLLVRLGVGDNEVPRFLAPRLKDYFPDPSSFADMDAGADLVWQAIRDGRRTAVFADYDVDGATSSALLAKYFHHYGRDLDLYVPDRLQEGYGPSPEAFLKLKNRGAELVITVDCGAAAEAALKSAEEIGLDIVVIDHHLMSQGIPRAAALINPNRPDCPSNQGHLAAAGVVYVFLAALNKRARRDPDMGDPPEIMDWLDLCALGTLCDMAPLHGVNRAFVRQGLKIMAAGRTVGIQALADVAGIPVPKSVNDATFGLGPRLNAGGRVGDPWIAAKLMACEDRTEAVKLAETLNQLNVARRQVEADILEAATRQAEHQLGSVPDLPVLVTASEGWHPGVIGIVAGRLKERFHLPAVVVGWGEGLGPTAKGSARSVKGINIGNAIAAAAKAGVVLSGGGHAMAGGVSLEPEQVDGFRAYLVELFRDEHDLLSAARDLEIDLTLSAGGVRRELIDELEQLGPFGAGAPEPVFCVQGVRVVSSAVIGKGHLKFQCQDETGQFDAIAWRAADTALSDWVRARSTLDVVGYLKPNDWRGRRAVQFEILDALLTDTIQA